MIATVDLWALGTFSFIVASGVSVRTFSLTANICLLCADGLGNRGCSIYAHIAAYVIHDYAVIPGHTDRPLETNAFLRKIFFRIKCTYSHITAFINTVYFKSSL